MSDLATPFRQRAAEALDDTFLRQALTIATTKFIDLRREAFDAFPEGEALRDRARAIKEATLQRLDHYLEELIDNVERRGGHVHYADTAADARRIILDVAARTYEFSQFLVKVLGRTRFRSAIPGRVTYHDSCHLRRGLGESESPRTILRNLEGAELVELPGSDECCGFGGSFAVRLPEVSTSILDKKLANAEATGARCVVACDAGCLMQMSGRLSRRNSPIRAVHLAEVLETDA